MKYFEFLILSAFIVVVFALALFCTWVYLRLIFGWTYCEDSNSTNCQACPKHAVCKRRDFVCQDGYERRVGLCVDSEVGSKENKAWKGLAVIETCLGRGRIETVSALKECTRRAGWDADSEIVEIGLAMTSEWVAVGNHIIRVPGEAQRRRRIVGLAWIAGTLWVLLLSLIYRRETEYQI
jgi:hypothetical protein